MFMEIPKIFIRDIFSYILFIWYTLIDETRQTELKLIAYFKRKYS